MVGDLSLSPSDFLRRLLRLAPDGRGKLELTRQGVGVVAVVIGGMGWSGGNRGSEVQTGAGAVPIKSAGGIKFCPPVASAAVAGHEVPATAGRPAHENARHHRRRDPESRNG